MVAIIGFFSIFLFVGSLIWLVIQITKKQKKRLPLLSMGIAIIVFSLAMANTPTPQKQISSDTTPAITTSSEQSSSTSDIIEETSSETTSSNISGNSSAIVEETTATPTNTTQNNAAPAPAPAKKEIVSTPVKETTYVGNAKTHKFHYPDCTWAEKIKSSNRVYFASRSEATSAGYVPCQKCYP